MKKNISLEIEGMLKAREDKITNIKKVLKDTKLQDTTRKSLENEIHRLENERETIVEGDTRCDLSFNNGNLIELTDEEISTILVWYEYKRTHSKIWSQDLYDLHDKLMHALMKL